MSPRSIAAVYSGLVIGVGHSKCTTISIPGSESVVGRELAASIFSQINRRGAGNRGFAHASFAGKEKKARRGQKKLHERRIALHIARKTIRSRSAKISGRSR